MPHWKTWEGFDGLFVSNYNLLFMMEKLDLQLPSFQRYSATELGCTGCRDLQGSAGMLGPLFEWGCRSRASRFHVSERTVDQPGQKWLSLMKTDAAETPRFRGKELMPLKKASRLRSPSRR